jgi:hypothetical protein
MDPLDHGIGRGRETFCHTPFLVSHSRTFSAPNGLRYDAHDSV